MQHQPDRADGEAAHRDDGGDPRQMKRQALASLKTVEIQRAQQGEDGQGADRQGSGLDDSCRLEAVDGEKRGGDETDGPDADDVESPKIEDTQSGGAALAAVEPEVGTKRPASRLAQRLRIIPARNGGPRSARLGVGALGRRGKESFNRRHEVRSVIRQQR
ncbi:hypothetical protein D3C72_1600520 [compost metagenome]